MIRDYFNEEWKEIIKEDYNPKKSKILISNYGRVKKKSSRAVKFKLANLPSVNNLEVFFYPREEKTQRAFCVHKMVAICFIEKKREDQTFVVHIDNNLKNNHVENLKFVNRAELSIHRRKNPNLEYCREKRKTNNKLRESEVKIIKKKLLDPNRKTRLRIIASQFNISQSQLWRIKTGENWGHIKV